ncbi:extracellular solute-binding protein [Paenibacillus allorhizosphaerae]|uniref:Lipoprotein LipO n=1 Tax=Paenibacillus allorhizosphaerae TaxID=2849866 RepID=A0ABM8VIG0_9BACL|nr:extracellular solute-binding protein [Paenibacillus allorhizosphaerae]CAG7644135.1 Lipoprotein LipO [Paenibacillus allorhizosphaerae]
MLNPKPLVRLLFCLLPACAFMLASCSSGVSLLNGDHSTKATVITSQIMNYAQTMVGEDNPLWNELEKRTHTDLKITWIPSTSFDDKIRMLLASRDLPDLTFVINLNMPILKDLVKEGLFWDLTPYIHEFPNLAALPDYSWENSKIFGKHYAVPRYYPVVGGEQFPMLRLDWLERMKMELPETMDDLYRVLYAFTYQDPDQNGKQDTIGFSGYFSALQFVFNAFNETGGAWKLRDGTLHPLITEDASRDALLWIKKAYDNKIIDPNLPILKLTQMEEAVKRSEAGATSLSMGYVWKFIEELRKTNPKADILPLSFLKGPNGVPYVPTTEGGYFGAYLIPKSVPESKMKKILQFLDYGYSPEGNDLVNFGLKGIHYTERDGIKTATEQAKKDLIIIGDNLGSIWRPLGDTQVVSAIGISPEINERNKRIVEQRSKSLPPNPAVGLYPEKYYDAWASLTSSVNDVRMKVIIGQMTIEAYDEWIQKLKQDDRYKKVVAEMNEAYRRKMTQ